MCKRLCQRAALTPAGLSLILVRDSQHALTAKRSSQKIFTHTLSSPLPLFYGITPPLISAPPESHTQLPPTPTQPSPPPHPTLLPQSRTTTTTTTTARSKFLEFNSNHHAASSSGQAPEARGVPPAGAGAAAERGRRRRWRGNDQDAQEEVLPAAGAREPVLGS